MTLHISVIKLAPCVGRHQPVLKISQSIVLHATGCSWVKNVFRIIWLKVKGKLVCQWRQVCRNCSFTVNGDSKHECFKRYCNYCNKKQLSDHFCYVAPLKPSKLTNRFMYVFFDRSANRTVKSMMGPLNIFRTSYVFSRYVPSVKRWMTWVLTLNSVVSVPTCFGRKNP